MTQIKAKVLSIFLLCALLSDVLAVSTGGATEKPTTKAGAATRDAKCMQPKEPGPCRMNLERYYYNADTNACELFKFGGCRGNDNKFGFRQTCEEACVRPKVGASGGSTSTSSPSTTSSTRAATSGIIAAPAKAAAPGVASVINNNNSNNNNKKIASNNNDNNKRQ